MCIKTAKLTIFLIFVVCIDVWAQEYNTIFYRANNFYREEKYDAAIQDYEQLINAGLRSANIFYNLGNAHLRVGNKCKAILYYERALRIRPRDADIRSNLNFARTLVEGNAEQDGGRWYARVFFFIRDFLSTNEMTFLAAVLYFTIMIFLALGLRRKFLYYFAAVFCVLLIAILPSLISGTYATEFQKNAVIMVKETEVRFEPNEDATVHFKLHEGAVIQVIKSQMNWHQIKRYDGKMGWLKGDVFIVI